ncbi:MAG: T9SS type A sorting domain-containing protein [Bacteroidia bacterium]|nr:T9SS type A sorting domain-containing protein [Bacteroidia bacterium]
MAKQKLLLLLLLALFIKKTSYSQNYNMSNDTVTTCSGSFYDSGGPLGNYLLNQSSTMTFTSSNGNRLLFNFSSLNTVYNLLVYDGSSSNAPLIGNYSGVLGAFSVQSSGTSLTFQFTSGNLSAQSAGWAATLSCTTPPETSYPLIDGQSITTCGGIFYDDGGADSNYAANQNSTMTFCPITANDYLVFDFTYQYNLSAGDTLFAYSGNNTLSAPIGIYTNANEAVTISSPQAGQCVTFKFVSDGGTAVGWQAFISCLTSPPSYVMSMLSGTILTCGGSFYDSGGASKNYVLNNSSKLTFTSFNGNRLLFNFSSLNTVYNLLVYDGSSSNAPLIGNYSGVSGAFSVQSSGTSLSFQFTSGNLSAQSAGWAATLSCTTPPETSYSLIDGQSITTCGGIFYDDGGADTNYAANQNSTMTFCPSTANDYLVFDFTYQYNLSAGDTLFAYSGNNTLSAPIGIYTNANEAVTISSPQAGQCVTFKFVSDGGTAAGWQAFISCVTTAPTYVMSMHSGTILTCGGTFYDSGGASKNYALNTTSTLTFTSSTGSRLLFNFSSLSTAYSLVVHDGNTLNAPIIGSYSGGLGAFSVQSTGTSLTFQFTSGNLSAQSAGWAATLSCTTAPLTTYPLINGQTITACEGVFYDDAGANSNYSPNQHATMTFCPNTVNDYLVFNFPYQFDLSSGDTLFVYSGSDTLTTPIGVYVGTLDGASISSPQPGACVTFKFVSDANAVSSGWQGILTCNTNAPVYTMSMLSGTIPTCGGLFYDSGGPAGNYKLNSTSTVTFTSSSGCAIKFDFGSLTTSYGLNAYDGTSTAAPLIGSYGSGLAPFTIQSSGSSITFEFTTGNIFAQSTGWGATISCPTTTSASITPSGPSTICAGDSVVLTATAAASYTWNTGDTTQSISVSSPGSYSVSIINTAGCTASSAPTQVLVNPLPAIPTIQLLGTSLVSSAGSNNQWYLNSQTIIGATSNTYQVSQNGSYTVQTTDSNGCSSISAPFNYTFVGLAEMQNDADFVIIPNPTNGKFKLQLNSTQSGKITVLNMLGEIIYETENIANEITLPTNLTGMYLLKLQSNNKSKFAKLIVE